MSLRSRVVLIQRIAPHYRLSFFRLLGNRLDREGVELVVAHGQHAPGSAPADVGRGKLGMRGERWAPNRYHHFLGRELVGKRIGPAVSGADLVVVEQAVRVLSTWHCLARHAVGRGPRLAFWGHGRNHQGRAESVAERLKRWVSVEPDFWFCYTEGVSGLLPMIPPERKISVDNAIDGRALEAELAAVRAAGVQRVQDRLAFIGSLHADRPLPLLFEALDLVYAARPAVTVDLVGDGPRRAEVVAFADARPWVRYLGPRFGMDKARVLAEAQCLLMPGMVGLVVLDAFIAGTPLITTAGPLHGPEIAYLDHMGNGVMTPGEPDAYAEGILSVLSDQECLDRLRDGCGRAASRYTVEHMVERFAEGVLRALALPQRPPLWRR